MPSGYIHERTFICHKQLLFPLLKTFFSVQLGLGNAHLQLGGLSEGTAEVGLTRSSVRMSPQQFSSANQCLGTAGTACAKESMGLLE